MANLIKLDRSFAKYDPDRLIDDYSQVSLWGAMSWDDVFQFPRVILVGLAGSGKTSEMELRRDELLTAGHYAVCVELKSVARLGFEAALSPNEKGRFRNWLNSNTDGYFFVDSKDEAVKAGESLDDAMRGMGSALEGQLHRARIVVSTRPSHLAATADQEVIVRFCPFETTYDPRCEPEEIWLSILEDEKASRVSKKKPAGTRTGAVLVVKLLPMSHADKNRYLQLAKNFSDTNADSLLNAIHAALFAGLAGYPRDLGIFAQYWQEHAKLGAYKEMLDAFCNRAIQESRITGPTRGDLTEAAAMKAVERLAGALVLTRRLGVVSADDTESVSDDVTANSLRPEDIWPNLSSAQRSDLLSRAIFDSHMIGRLHLRADVLEFLAARWLGSCFEPEAAQHELWRELLAEWGGEKIAVESRIGVSFVLALNNDALFRELISRNPLRFLSDTITVALSESQRLDLFDACVNRIAQGEEIPKFNWAPIDPAILRALTSLACQRSLADKWQNLVESNEKAEETEQLRAFLLWFLRVAVEHTCVDVAFSAATNKKWGHRTNVLGIQALAQAQDKVRSAEFIRSFISSQNAAAHHDELTYQVIESFFPEQLNVPDVIELLYSLRSRKEESAGAHLVSGWAERIPAHDLRVSYLVDCCTRIKQQLRYLEGDYDPYPLKPALCAFSLGFANRLFELERPHTGDHSTTSELHSNIAFLLTLRSDAVGDSEQRQTLVKAIEAHASESRLIYWEIVVTRRSRAERRKQRHPVDHPMSIDSPFHVNWSKSDCSHLLAIVQSNRHDDDKKIAMWLLYFTLDLKDAGNDEVEEVRRAIEGQEQLILLLDDFLKPREKMREDAEMLKYARTQLKKGENAREKWLNFLAKLQNDKRPVSTSDLRWISEWLRRRSQLDSNSAEISGAHGQLRSLRYAVGEISYGRILATLKSSWRAIDIKPPPTSSEPWADYQDRKLAMLAIEANVLEVPSVNISTWAPSDVDRALDVAIAAGDMADWIDRFLPKYDHQVRNKIGTWVLSWLDVDEVRGQPVERLAGRLPKLRALLAPMLLVWLIRTEVISASDNRLDRLLAILFSTDVARDAALAKVLAQRASTENPLRRIYLKYLLAVDAPAALEILRIDNAESKYSVRSVEGLCVLQRDRSQGVDIGFCPSTAADTQRKVLLGLVEVMCDAVDPAHDKKRPDHGPYKPAPRDQAQDVRDSAIASVGKIPGVETLVTLEQLENLPKLKGMSRWISRMKRERIEVDSEPTALTVTQVLEVEAHGEATPRTGYQLLNLVVKRLHDIEHDLRHGDFSCAGVLRNAKSEADFQSWLAHELRLRANHRYSVKRETQVVDNKRPDIEICTTSSDVAVAIEMKLADNWVKFDALAAGLTDQLIGKYLRDSARKHGIYILVRLRKEFWRAANGEKLSFRHVLGRLKELSQSQAKLTDEGGQVIVFTPTS